MPIHLNDESLIARVARGDRNALEILYDRHAARVLGLLRQTVGERAAAEELLQEVFWQVWLSSATFSSQYGSFTGWLFMIVRKLTITSNSPRNPGYQMMIEMTDEDLILDSDRKATQIRNALRSLPQEQRQVIEMAYFHGMTRQEIANSTGETLDTISGFARLALQKMKEALERDDNIE